MKILYPQIILVMVFLTGCTKTPTVSTATAANGTIDFNGLNYTTNQNIAIKNNNNYVITLKYSPTSGTLSDLFQLIIYYNTVNKDSTYIAVQEMKSGVNVNFYNWANSGKKKPAPNQTENILIYEYKKSPNIIVNANGTLTINDTFKCFKPTGSTTIIDTTRYSAIVHSVTTQ